MAGTILHQIRKNLNLKHGDLVAFVKTDAGVMMKPASLASIEELQAEAAAVVYRAREKFKDETEGEIASLVDDAIRVTRGERA
jgi:bifunctional DNA-binding transcriptional regulator/antitoxin component of YhaV-PrlF toxin-antitoxin module